MRVLAECASDESMDWPGTVSFLGIFAIILIGYLGWLKWGRRD